MADWQLFVRREQMLGYDNKGKGLLALVRRVVRMKQVVRVTLIAAVTLGVVSGVCPSSFFPPMHLLTYHLTRP